MKAHPKSFDLSKIWAKSNKNWAKKIRQFNNLNEIALCHWHHIHNRPVMNVGCYERVCHKRVCCERVCYCYKRGLLWTGLFRMVCYEQVCFERDTALLGWKGCSFERGLLIQLVSDNAIVQRSELFCGWAIKKQSSSTKFSVFRSMAMLDEHMHHQL